MQQLLPECGIPQRPDGDVSRGVLWRFREDVLAKMQEISKLVSELQTPELKDAIRRLQEALAEVDPRKSQVVELRYFGGLGDEEIAQVIGVSTRTVKREWRWAKAWLYRELGDERSR